MSFFDSITSVKNQFLFKNKEGAELWLKREDQLHTVVSGNKFRKLKYNLASAKEENHHTLLTYGGAFSNHIAATAKAGNLEGFKTIGIIRGEELAENFDKTLTQNETLRYAAQCGMHLHFVTRNAYRAKENPEFQQRLKNLFGTFYNIPEGGTNTRAIKGCKEILTSSDKDFDMICCAVGTGGTIAGIIESAENHQKILGFPALKGDFLTSEIKKYTTKNNWELINAFHFGGYAKITPDLVTFINEFKLKYNIQLDPIYTGKMIYGIIDLMRQGYFSKNTRILAVHTGGLQGISGINARLKKQGVPALIAYDD